MSRCLVLVMLSGLAIVQSAYSSAQTSGSLSPIPPGKSTVIGGAIRNVDPVRDQFTLKVFGGRSMKILYDERTQVFRDGTRIPLRDLGAEDHASIQTVLDGTNVFAVSIHMLSRSPEGEVQGQVVDYNKVTGVLTVNDPLVREPIRLQVPAGTAVVRVGRSSPSAASGPEDLRAGTLVDVKFTPGNQGRGVTSQISILAAPGSAFVFSGEVSLIDLHAGRLVLVDPRDEQRYRISLDPSRFPSSRDLHPGSHVTVNADFDGAQYVARSITVN